MRKVGPIQCLEVVQDPEAPWVILFHGYGADSSDLEPLAQMIPLNSPCNYLFPHGLIEVPIGPMWTGRAWWNLDLAKIQREAHGGQEWDTSNEIPATLPSVREKAMQMIEAMRVPWSKIILGGFSQGSMLATDLTLNAPESPLGLAIMSGALINKAQWKELAPRRAGLPFFQCHGDQDTVLPYKNASRLETLLISGGLKGSLMRFSGGHTIPSNALERMGKYIDDRLKTLN